jgi:hypothetical protein
LLGSRQLTERHGTAKYQYGKCRKLRRSLAGKDVLLASMAQKMDRSRVQAIRYFEPEWLLRTRHTTQLSTAKRLA